MVESISETWMRLPTPESNEELSTAQVKGTNCWVFKDSQNDLGFLMSGVYPPSYNPNLSNIKIIHIPEKQVYQPKSTISPIKSLRRCLEIHLDSSCDSELLTLVLDRMAAHEPSGHYSTDLFLNVLNQVIRLVQKSNKPPTKEEVIGAHGELQIIYHLAKIYNSPRELQRIISYWEAEGKSRDIIDFRFPHLNNGIALEIKTSISSRIHHINSIDQIIIPDNFSLGILGSILLRESDGTSGLNNSQLITNIEKLFIGSIDEISNLKRTFHSKLDMRGKCCYDDNYHFLLPDEGIRMINMSDVPKPVVSHEITDVEWKVNLVNTEFKTFSSHFS